MSRLNTILLTIFVLLALFFLYEKMFKKVYLADGETPEQERERMRASSEMIPTQRIR